ncbi:hypothetical protein [Bremerella sp. P1]|uniref:hypothetical protein n=1 Tax=Bremerella sp. P1 TaxID=3026424 RepID=UPI00236826D3|nr:hypothetical protein [Bremerella sp. P1]WDI44773.1 hypothetical protein PSR63_12585 [Bremerella sp. P1]
MTSFSTSPPAKDTITEVAVATSVGSSTAVNIQDFNAGIVKINTGSITDVAVTPYICETESGTYMPVYVAANTAADLITVSSSQCYAIPSSAMNGNYLKLVGGSAIADTTIILKRI